MSVRSDMLIALTCESHEVLPDPTDDDLFQCIEDCTGWTLSNRERRLVKIAFDEGEVVARKSIHYYR